jgi:hypothetical protein
MTDACAAAEPDPYALTLSFKGATATLQFHFVDFVDAKSAYDAVQRARRALPVPGGAGEAAPLTSLEIADHFGSVAEVDASAVAACVLTRTARALEAALDSGIVAARMEAKLQSTLRRDPVLRSTANAMQVPRPPFRTESRISNFVEEPRTCRFR